MRASLRVLLCALALTGAACGTTVPGHHDGLGAYYDFGFVETCQCMNYTSAPHQLPR